MKPGEVIESAIWITGAESKETRAMYEQDVIAAIDHICQEYEVSHGPVKFTEKHPMDDRVPEVPDHVSGPRVRLLVAEADIIGKAVKAVPDSFIANLEPKDLKRLRTITRRTWAEKTHKILTDVQCDEMIETLGPEAALESLRSLH